MRKFRKSAEGYRQKVTRDWVSAYTGWKALLYRREWVKRVENMSGMRARPMRMNHSALLGVSLRN